MILFVDIETEKFYSFNSWDDIVALGGLSFLFPPDIYKNLYNEAACIETINSVKPWGAEKDLTPFKKALDLFNEINNKNGI